MGSNGSICHGKGDICRVQTWGSGGSGGSGDILWHPEGKEGQGGRELRGLSSRHEPQLLEGHSTSMAELSFLQFSSHQQTSESELFLSQV